MMMENPMSPTRIRFWSATATVLIILAVVMSTPFISDSPMVLFWTRIGTYVSLAVLGIVGLRTSRYRQHAIGILFGCGVILIPMFMLIVNLVLTGSVM